jgi:hypothetical protein
MMKSGNFLSLKMLWGGHAPLFRLEEALMAMVCSKEQWVDNTHCARNVDRFNQLLLCMKLYFNYQLPRAAGMCLVAVSPRGTPAGAFGGARYNVGVDCCSGYAAEEGCLHGRGSRAKHHACVRDDARTFLHFGPFLGLLAPAARLTLCSIIQPSFSSGCRDAMPSECTVFTTVTL